MRTTALHEIWVYPAEAMGEDALGPLFCVASGYQPARDGIRLSVTKTAGDDGGIAIACRADGAVLAAGVFVRAPCGTLGPAGAIGRRRGGLTLERVVLGGQTVGYIASVPPEVGREYRLIATPDTGTGAETVATGALETSPRLRPLPGLAATGFAATTMIATLDGALPAEWLRPGDRVLTRDAGYQPILWLARFAGPARRAASGAAAATPTIPHRLAGSSLGPGLPERDLIVAPGQGVLLSGPALDLHFGEQEMLAAAADLFPSAGPEAAAEAKVEAPAALCQVILPQHELILAEGLWIESLLVDRVFLAAQEPRLRAVLTALTGGRHVRSARARLETWKTALFRAPDLIATGRRAA